MFPSAPRAGPSGSTTVDFYGNTSLREDSVDTAPSAILGRGPCLTYQGEDTGPVPSLSKWSVLRGLFRPSEYLTPD